MKYFETLKNHKFLKCKFCRNDLDLFSVLNISELPKTVGLNQSCFWEFRYVQLKRVPTHSYKTYTLILFCHSNTLWAMNTMAVCGNFCPIIICMSKKSRNGFFYHHYLIHTIWQVNKMWILEKSKWKIVFTTLHITFSQSKTSLDY